MEPHLIPNLDPNPLPAPFWVFKLLLLVTFLLHILAMNFLLGGSVLALLAKWLPGDKKHRDHIFGDIAKKLPIFLPATITLGIAPLLFVQVLYGQFFYTSSAILAWPWFLVLVFLTTAYYGFYYVSFQNARQPGSAGGVMLLSVLLVFSIGFIYSNNMTLSLTPSRWKAKYFAGPGGWNLNLLEPTLIPRFLHFFTGALAVAGLLLVFLAYFRSRKDADYGRALFEFGGRAYAYATMAQFMIGLWFLTSLPHDLLISLLLGKNPLALILLAVGAVGGIAGILLMSNALHKDNLRMGACVVPIVTLIVIACMIGLRDILRDAYLKPYFQPGQFAVQTQWSVLPLFLVLFLAGVGLWFVMLKRYGLFASPKS